MDVYENVSDLVGGTPLVTTTLLPESRATVPATLDFCTPACSVEDRIPERERHLPSVLHADLMD